MELPLLIKVSVQDRYVRNYNRIRYDKHFWLPQLH